MIRDVARTPVEPTLVIGGGIALAKVAATAPFMARYGWDRDELYFLAAARHPAFGYVDFPPVTAWIGWLVVHTAGASLIALRATGQIAGAVAVVLVALIARELGGGRGAQALAAGAWALTPFALGAGTIFHPTQFDALMWPAVLYVALRIAARPEPRLWPLLGMLAGIGLETKYTIVVLLACLVAALAASPRRRLYRTRGPWVAALIAVLDGAEPGVAGRERLAQRRLLPEPAGEDRRRRFALLFVLQSVAFLGVDGCWSCSGSSRSGGGRCCGRSPLCRLRRWCSWSSADGATTRCRRTAWPPRPVPSWPRSGSAVSSGAVGSRSPPPWHCTRSCCGSSRRWSSRCGARSG